MCGDIKTMNYVLDIYNKNESNSRVRRKRRVKKEVLFEYS